MSQEYLQKMKQLALEAGEITLRYRNNSSPSYKSDKSIVTRADKEISALAKVLFKDFLTLPGHILIDEEDAASVEYLDEKSLEKASHIFAIDPVDGTRIYANGMPNFGVSIGLLKDRKPWLGVVYFPVLGELFFCDSRQSYFVRNAFKKEEEKSPLKPIDQEINKQTLFLLPDAFFNRFDWDFTDCHILIPACAVVDLCWPAIGRGCGCVLKSYIWDFAGSWPIALSAGLKLRNWRTGKVLERVEADLFSKAETPWKLKDYYILSSERNFPILRDKIKLKNNKKS